MSYLRETTNRRCLFGCDPLVVRSVPTHLFPHPNKKADLFRAWVSAVGHHLKESLPMRIYNNKRVCGRHFLDIQKVRFGRLVHDAIPCVNLHGIRQSISHILECEHNYCYNTSGLTEGTTTARPDSNETVVAMTSSDHTQRLSAFTNRAGVTIHDFPHQDSLPQQFQIWVDIIGVPLANLTEEDIYREKSVSYSYHWKDLESKQPLKFIGCTLFEPTWNRMCADCGGMSKLHFQSAQVFFRLGTADPCDDGGALQVSGDARSHSETETFSWEKKEVIPVHAEDAVEVPTQPVLDTVCDSDTELYEQCPSKNPLESDAVRHDGFQCNVCEAHIRGFRYTCVQCADFDLCGGCEAGAAHAHHYLLRIPEARPFHEIQMVLRSVRRELNVIVQSSQNALEETILDQVKLEIKEEPFDPLDGSAPRTPHDEYMLNTLYDEMSLGNGIDSGRPGGASPPGSDHDVHEPIYRPTARRRRGSLLDHETIASRVRSRKRKHIETSSNRSETEDFSTFEDDDYCPDNDDYSNDERVNIRNSDVQTLPSDRFKLVDKSDKTCVNSASKDVHPKLVTKIKVGDIVIPLIKLKRPLVRIDL